MKKKIILFIAISLIILHSCKYIGETSCRDWLLKNDIETSFSGYVIKKYVDTSKRESRMVVLNSSHTFFIYNDIFYNQLEIGDSVYKKSGSLKYYLVKNGMTRIFYQQCSGIDITDEYAKKTKYYNENE